MQFQQWITDYMNYQRQTPKKGRREYLDFMIWRMQAMKSNGIPPWRNIAEKQWEESGYPYYNVHPKLTSKLCRVDLTKLPSTLLKMPHGLPAVNIRLAEKHPEFTVTETVEHDINKFVHGADIPAGSYVRSILMNRPPFDRPDIPAFVFLMDFGVVTSFGQPSYCIFGVKVGEDISLERAIELASARRSGSYDDMICNILRLAATIGFLADNPTICEADVLADDRQKYHQATDEQREVIAARAKRRGKFGFNLGTDLMFLGERPKNFGPRSSIETGRELEYAHIRAGHPHTVRHGEGKRMVKIMWYLPTTVREDLPFKG